MHKTQLFLLFIRKKKTVPFIFDEKEKISEAWSNTQMTDQSSRRSRERNIQRWRRGGDGADGSRHGESPSSSGSSSAACYPRWVILERHCKSTVDDDLSCAKAVAAKTMAAARTSNGHPIQFSLSLAEPPATSSVRVKFPDGVHLKYCITMAAHGDSLLIVVNFNQWCDHFVYNAGDAAADPPRPPSLLLLLQRYLSANEDDCRRYPGLQAGVGIP